jgi:hypothetical protein
MQDFGKYRGMRLVRLKGTWRRGEGESSERVRRRMRIREKAREG